MHWALRFDSARLFLRVATLVSLQSGWLAEKLIEHAAGILAGDDPEWDASGEIEAAIEGVEN